MNSTYLALGITVTSAVDLEVDGQQTVDIVLLSKAVVKINQKDTVRTVGGGYFWV
jgi:hypothetical protein